MPSVCRVYELIGAELEGVTEALKRAGILSKRSGAAISGDLELQGGLKVPFEIFSFRGKLFLMVLAGGKRALRVARKVAEVAGADVQEVRLNVKRLLELYGESVVKVVAFDMVRVPGLRKVILTGESVSDTPLFKELFETCEIRYAMLRTGEGHVIGVSSSGAVVALSRLSDEELLSFVKETLLPLASA